MVQNFRIFRIKLLRRHVYYHQLSDVIPERESQVRCQRGQPPSPFFLKTRLSSHRPHSLRVSLTLQLQVGIKHYKGHCYLERNATYRSWFYYLITLSIAGTTVGRYTVSDAATAEHVTYTFTGSLKVFTTFLCCCLL